MTTAFIKQLLQADAGWKDIALRHVFSNLTAPDGRSLETFESGALFDELLQMDDKQLKSLFEDGAWEWRLQERYEDMCAEKAVETAVNMVHMLDGNSRHMISREAELQLVAPEGGLHSQTLTACVKWVQDHAQHYSADGVYRHTFTKLAAEMEKALSPLAQPPRATASTLLDAGPTTVADLWSRNDIQFPRLLSEIVATQDKLDMPALAESMDLDVSEVDDLFERAQTAWQIHLGQLRESGGKLAGTGTFNVWCRQSDGRGTTWISKVVAPTQDEAIAAGRKACASDWGQEGREFQILVVGVQPTSAADGELVWDDEGLSEDADDRGDEVQTEGAQP